MKKETKRFVVHAFVFLVIIVILILLFNLAYKSYVSTKTIKHRKEAAYDEYIKSLPEKEIDLAFFGDSHVIFAINPEYIPGSFNYGVESEHYLTTYFKFRDILFDEKLKINTAVFQIDMHTFSSYMINAEFLTTADLLQNARYMSLKQLQGTYEKSAAELWLRINFPVIGNGEDFFTVQEVDLTTVSKAGYIRSEKNFSNMNKTHFANYRYENQYRGRTRITPELLEAFKETLFLAKQMDIDVVLVKYPHSSAYNDMLVERNIDKDGYYKTIYDAADSVLGKGNYLVLDYHDYYFGRDDYMMDADHVNWAGAKMLSQQIYKDLQEAKLTKDTRKKNVLEVLTT